MQNAHDKQSSKCCNSAFAKKLLHASGKCTCATIVGRDEGVERIEGTDVLVPRHAPGQHWSWGKKRVGRKDRGWLGRTRIGVGTDLEAHHFDDSRGGEADVAVETLEEGAHLHRAERVSERANNSKSA
eukprot:2819233-Rhodomonas_salina.1